ncbi:MAG: nucleotidyltransferase family protein [bacterium]|nr:nucleotidyltransferase family protein [bacterium]
MHTSHDSVCALVLAAGFSTRMGRPKALLDWHGAPFLAQICRTLTAAGMSRIIVVTNATNDKECRLQANPADAGVVWVINPRPEDGMLSSIRCGLGALGGTRAQVLLCLVDHPGVQAATYRTLAAHAAAGTIVVPTHAGRRGHPTVFGADFIDELRHGACPDGARSVVRAHPDALREIVVDDPLVLADIDTPADYAAATAER